MSGLDALNEASICIADNGELYDLKEIIGELRLHYDRYSTHSMNETALYLQGRKDGLLEVIKYLQRIIGEADED